MYKDATLIVSESTAEEILAKKPKWQKAQMKEMGDYIWVKFMKPEYITCFHRNGQSSTMLRYWTNVWDKYNNCPCTIIPERINLLEEYIYEGESDPRIIYQ